MERNTRMKEKQSKSRERMEIGARKYKGKNKIQDKVGNGKENKKSDRRKRGKRTGEIGKRKDKILLS